MSLDKFKVPGTCKVKYIAKLYFKKYKHKLVFEIDKTKLVKSPNSDKMSYWSYRTNLYLNRGELVTNLQRLIRRELHNDDFRLRVESTRVSVFTNDEDDITALLKKASARLIEFEYPLNDNHANLIDEHRKVVVRPSLFEKFYKFKIYLKHDYKAREARYADLKEFMDTFGKRGEDWEVNSGLKYLFYTDRKTKFAGYTMAVYLKNADDLMMFQLKYNDNISKIEEAVLISDLQ